MEVSIGTQARTCKCPITATLFLNVELIHSQGSMAEVRKDTTCLLAYRPPYTQLTFLLGSRPPA